MNDYILLQPDNDTYVISTAIALDGKLSGLHMGLLRGYLQRVYDSCDVAGEFKLAHFGDVLVVSFGRSISGDTGVRGTWLTPYWVMDQLERELDVWFNLDTADTDGTSLLVGKLQARLKSRNAQVHGLPCQKGKLFKVELVLSANHPNETQDLMDLLKFQLAVVLPNLRLSVCSQSYRPLTPEEMED